MEPTSFPLNLSDKPSMNSTLNEVELTQEQLKQKQAQKKAQWDHRVVMIITISACTVAVAVVAEIACLMHEIIKDRIWKPDIKLLEEEVKNRYSTDFVEKIKQIGLDRIFLFKRLSISQTDEYEIINYLISNFDISTEQLAEILKGAHIRLDDEGSAYDIWVQKIKEKQQRISSHHSDENQYGVQGALIKELLFSRLTDNGKKYTWFQLENHPVSFGHIIRHMWDYMKYKIRQENQGPYGSSRKTDSFPITLKRKTV